MALDIKIKNCPESEMRSSNIPAELPFFVICPSWVRALSPIQKCLYLVLTLSPHFRDMCLRGKVFHTCTGL